MVVTESWPPNAERARARLGPRGVRVVETREGSPLPFADASFDLVFHPSSNSYVDDVRAVWSEAHRVLRPGGTLIAGFNNPATYVFDLAELDAGRLTVRHRLPFSDADDLPPAERDAQVAAGVALEHSHTLDELLGGQLDAGFEIIGFYEDRQSGQLVSEHMPTAIATRARRVDRAA